jgi:hypothetical protein
VAELPSLKILRKVARQAVADARAALETAHSAATDDQLLSAYRACVFAARALRRASVDSPAPDEKAMIEQSIRFDEEGYSLRRRLVQTALDVE